MYRCVLWGTGRTFTDSLNTIKLLELSGKIKVCAITDSCRIYSEVFGYKYFQKSELTKIDFDTIILTVSRKRYVEVMSEAEEIGISVNKIIPISAFNIPGFTFDRYLYLKSRKMTILSNNCSAGILYHYLSLEFNSPTINMFIKDMDYLRLCSNLQYYMELSLVFDHSEYNDNLEIQYPVCRCGDIFLYFNHSKTFEDAVNDWERRKKRINWKETVILMYTEDKLVANEFERLPHKKKMCFTTFDMDGKDYCFINLKKTLSLEGVPLWSIVNGIAGGQYVYIDWLEFLAEGLVEKLAVFAG